MSIELMVKSNLTLYSTHYITDRYFSTSILSQQDGFYELVACEAGGVPARWAARLSCRLTHLLPVDCYRLEL